MEDVIDTHKLIFIRDILIYGGVFLIAWWVYRLLRLRQQIKTYNEYWKNEQTVSGELVYVALGDSAAQGIGASTPERSYVALLVEYIAAQTGMKVQVINLSKTGAKLADVLDTQLQQLSKLQPDFVTVDIGGNDIRGFSEERFSTEIEQICRLLPSGTLISDIPYFMHGNAEVNAGRASCFLSDQARQNDLILIELHQSLRDRGWKAMFTDFASDWFHPNDSGYMVWFESYKPGIDKKLIEMNLLNKK